MATELDLAYDHCQRVAKQNARSFYYASLPLPRDKRRAIYAVYAYCRLCDDIADGDLSIGEKYRGFAEVRRNLQSSTTTGEDAQMYLALRHAAETFGIPYSYLDEILQGVEMDMVKTRFADFDELREYCYKVASVVGLVCIRIFGYTDADAEEYAADMGLALQLTNILRDVKEDIERCRVYIPQDEMRRFGYTEAELERGAMTDGFRALMAHQAQRAQEYYDRSRALFPLIAADARACPQLMHATYGGILERIEQSGYNVFERRIGLSKPEKLMLLARLGLSGLLSALSLRRAKR
ncbi:MAG: squalene/phytoene synthase family protein [Chloroflexota bacterium]|nr:squalene/phytoene synthase family protein [Chloroflexota bacterium]